MSKPSYGVKGTRFVVPDLRGLLRRDISSDNPFGVLWPGRCPVERLPQAYGKAVDSRCVLDLYWTGRHGGRRQVVPLTTRAGTFALSSVNHIAAIQLGSVTIASSS
jgi:hypothetical protein